MPIAWDRFVEAFDIRSGLAAVPVPADEPLPVSLIALMDDALRGT